MKVLLMCTVLSTGFLCADVPDKPIQVNVNVSLDNEPAGSQESLGVGSALAAAGIGATTGFVMFYGTVLSKNFEGFTPVTYALVGSVLLYSQRDIIKRLLGSTYTGVANWASMVALIGTGCIETALNKCKQLKDRVLHTQPVGRQA